MSDPGVTDFSTFSSRSHSEKIEDAVVELLLADSEIQTFCNDRVYRIANPFAFPDRPLPYIVVMGPSEQRVFDLNREADVTLQVHIGVMYDEVRDVVGTGDQSVKSLMNKITSILISDPVFQTTSFGQLVDRFDSIETVAYGQVEFADGSTSLYLQMVAQYKFIVDAATGVRQ